MSAAAGGHQGARAVTGAAFVLVHGAWHGAWCFERVIADLAALGHVSMARDLPGHGLNARLPASYAIRPVTAAFATEPSPVAATTLDDYADSVIATLDQACAGHGKVVLVGHSMGGVVITRVGEIAPDRISKLVYLAGHMPGSGVPMGAYFQAPEAAAGHAGATLLGDASATGAFRIDPRSTDASYRASLKRGYYNDVSEAEFEAVRNLLTPDMPLEPMITPIALSPERWGALPRHFIQCLRDEALPLALTRRLIAEADALTPENPTRVHTLDTGHSPFLSAPGALARLLSTIAGSTR